MTIVAIVVQSWIGVMMSDLIRRADAIDEIREVYEQEFPTASGAFDEFVVTIIPNILRNIPSAEPDNQVHLCNSCKYDYPECPTEESDVIFGNGIGHDNICSYTKFEIKPKRKKGKWQVTSIKGETWGICSNCNFKQKAGELNFCPNCGMDMRGEE